MLRLLFMPILLGYFLAYSLFIRRSIAFFPAIFVSFAALSVFVSGLFGSLTPGVLAVCAGGCVLLVLSAVWLITRPGELRRVGANVFSLEMLFLLLSVGIAFLITRDSLISHWDDFSHWYRICKLLHCDNTLPTQPDIKYPTYVPGAACWIYFVTRFLTFKQYNCLFAQSLMNIAFCMPLFSVIPQKIKRTERIAGVVVVCLTAIMTYGMYVSIFSLLVDVLVAVVPMSAILIISDEPNARRTLPMALLLSCFGGLIKTSGLLFCASIACAYAYGRRRDRRIVLRSALLFLLPLGLTAAYQARANAIFSNIAQSGQAMSLERYSTIFSGKSLNDILLIMVNYLKNLFDLHAACDQVLLNWAFVAALIVVWAGITLIGEEQLAQRISRGIAACAAVIVLYNIGLLGTYLFSMAEPEANLSFLACFGRYFGTCAIFIAGLVTAYLLRIFYQLPNRRHRLPAISMLALFVFLVGSTLTHSSYIFGWLFDDPYETEYRDYFNQDINYLIPEQKEYNESKYVILMACDERYGSNLFYAEDAAQTHLRSNDVFICDAERLIDGELSEYEINRILSCDHLYLMNEELEAQIRAVLPISEKLSDTAEYVLLRGNP